MKQPHPSADYSILTIMGYDAENSVYEVQIAPVGDGGSSIPGEARHPYGFLGVPNDGDADSDGNYTNGAFTRIDKEGSTLHVLVLDDLRVTARLPQIGKGASLQYGANPDGTPSLWLHDGHGNVLGQVATGKTITISVAQSPALKFHDSFVDVGDDPVPLTIGAATTSLKTALAAFATALVSATDPAVTGAATTLSSALQAITDILTTQFRGT